MRKTTIEEKKTEEVPVEETPEKETCVYIFRGTALARMPWLEAERYEVEPEQKLLEMKYQHAATILNAKIFSPLPEAPEVPYQIFVLIEFDDINYLICCKNMLDMRNFMMNYGLMTPFIDHFLPDKRPEQRVLRYVLGLKYEPRIGKTDLFY